jgi:hypothetical protein
VKEITYLGEFFAGILEMEGFVASRLQDIV